MTPTLRPWVPADNEKILEIEVACFPDPWNARMLSSLFSTGDYVNLLIEEKGQILAYMSVFAGLFDWEVMKIAVHPSLRRKGFGAMLLKEATSLATDKGAERFLLEVRSTNVPAISLYRRFGFKVDGVRKGYYLDGEDCLLMSLELSRGL